MLRTLSALAAGLALVSCAAPSTKPTSDAPHWTPLFNGHDLTGWTPKFSGFPLGENYLDTFRVEDGLLKVDYDKWSALDGHFGHLFYATAFKNYRLHVEYRFVGAQIAGGPEWALRNNGVMIMSQPPETMGLNQDFPDSVEVQLLGGDGVTPRSTANMCSPETSVVMNGERVTQHCVSSGGPTFTDGEWVTVEIEVRDGHVRLFVNGAQVMEYSDPMLDAPQPWAPDQHLTSGYIAIQAESAPCEFRRIDIMNLDDH